MSQKPKYSAKPRFSKGFRRASTLVQDRIRDGGASRGFAVSRLLTHWSEIVGEETARATRPVNVSYGKGGMGATLTVLTRGAMGPELQMQEPKIREKVNACYGYQAISRIRFTQTAGTGFAEGQAQFAPAPRADAKAAVPGPEQARAGAEMSQGVQDEGLRELLAELGAKVLTRRSD